MSKVTAQKRFNTQFIVSLSFVDQERYYHALADLRRNQVAGWRDFGSKILRELDGMGLYERRGRYVFITRKGIEAYQELKDHLWWRKDQ